MRYWMMLLVLPLAAQDLTYRGMGAPCQGPGFSVNNFGEMIFVSQVNAEKAVKAGCQLMPDATFAGIGFTTNEISAYKYRNSWINAPDSFTVKVGQMNDAFIAYRSALIAGSDGAAPIVSNVQRSLTDTSLTVTWTTNEPATSQIEYGATTSYGAATVLDSNLLTSHSQTVSGLTAGASYHYRIKSKDGANNLTTTSDLTFTLLSASTGSISFADDEVPSGVIDGTNLVFTLANAPSPAKSLKVYRNGIKQLVGADFTFTGSTITFVTGAVPQANDLLTADYRF